MKYLLIAALFFFISASSVFAQQGCCSWHGGVCGNSCCDGTALSAKCGGGYDYTYDEPVRTFAQNTQWCGAGEWFISKAAAQNSLDEYHKVQFADITRALNNCEETKESHSDYINTLSDQVKSQQVSLWLAIACYVLTGIVLMLRYPDKQGDLFGVGVITPIIIVVIYWILSS